MIKVGGKQNPYEMWQAGNSLAASPLANFLAGFVREDGGSALDRQKKVSLIILRIS